MSYTRNHFFTDTFEHNVSLMWTSAHIKTTVMFDSIFMKYKNSDCNHDLSKEFHFLYQFNGQSVCMDVFKHMRTHMAKYS